jgi:hypothetical protein
MKLKFNTAHDAVACWAAIERAEITIEGPRQARMMANEVGFTIYVNDGTTFVKRGTFASMTLPRTSAG